MPDDSNDILWVTNAGMYLGAGLNDNLPLRIDAGVEKYMNRRSWTWKIRPHSDLPAVARLKDWIVDLARMGDNVRRHGQSPLRNISGNRGGIGGQSTCLPTLRSLKAEWFAGSKIRPTLRSAGLLPL